MKPPVLSSHGRHLLGSLLDSPANLVDLGHLEHALRALDVGDDLAASLERLGFPLSIEALQRRRRRQQTNDVRRAVRDVVEEWSEPWSGEWFEQTWKAGVFRSMDTTQALGLAADVRRLLDVDGGFDALQWSRTQLAAMVVGSAHALDRGSRLEAAAARALCFRHDIDFDATDRNDIWDAIGAPVDIVSKPVLTWALPLRSSPLAVMAEAAMSAGVPLYVSTAALRRHAIDVERGTDVLVVENPRVIEAAMERGVPLPMVCGNGNPTFAVRLLVDRLLQAGATVRCHGDFDAAGLAIVARFAAQGCVPWEMNAEDYLDALQAAGVDGVTLPAETRQVPATPWDPALAQAFEEHRSIVHEERLIDGMLTAIRAELGH